MAAPEKLPVENLYRTLSEVLPSPTLSTEIVTPLHAAGRTCARDMFARVNLPPCAVARVDGLANTGLEDGATYRIARTSLPGDAPPAAPEKGEAVRVSTGGPLPAGCTGVVPVEHTEAEGETVRVIQAMNVPATPAGGQIQKGDRVVEKGAVIHPQQAGWLADLGETEIRVFPRPQVAILPTGTELVGTGSLPSGNAVRLFGMVERAGGAPVVLPPVPDEADAIATAISSTDARLILTTGGTARGVRDVTCKAIKQAGFDVVLDGLNARPGQAVRLGVKEGQLLLSLPGMPGGLPPLCALLVTPLIRKLSGDRCWEPEGLFATLACAHDEHRPMPLITGATLRVTEQGLAATIVPHVANGFVILPKGRETLSAGTKLPALLTDLPFA